jgi:phosphatidylserine decarboxylase
VLAYGVRVMTASSSKNESLLGHLTNLARAQVPPMHPGGRPFVLGLLGAAAAARMISRPLGRVALVGAAAVALFFREPKRVPPVVAGAVAAAADGLVSLVDEAAPPAEVGLDGGPRPRVSVFLSVLDVHVQRAPVSGTVVGKDYRPGKFLSADLDKASEDNERATTVLRTEDGHELVVVQIAGLVARRIVTDVEVGQRLEIGQTFGLIRFGSRVDVYLPHGSEVLVREGQRTIGGETVIARLPEAMLSDADSERG